MCCTVDVTTSSTIGGEEQRPGALRPARPAGDQARRADLLALAVLLALPVVVFGGPALVGHPALPGDDLTQNYPLRVLVGAELRHGHLPVLDPYIWSGAPLLGGWNAGAAYPLTWLFAVLPGSLAWSVGLVATSWAAGVGAFLFLRASGLAPLASWLGAFTFSFSGAMVAQVVHFGLVAGMSWVPLALLAVLRLSEERRARSAAAWTAALGAAVGLTILAGEPRAVADAAVVVLPYGAWRVVRRPRPRWQALVSTAGGVVLGVGLGAVQWAPGLAAVASSQRAAADAVLFTSGSLPLRWLTLLGVPDLLGGSGSFGQPAFLAGYNLTEVTGYVGVLPLVAAFALLGRYRLRRPLPEFAVWHLLAAAGIVLALGGNTPLWHLLVRIPLFGDQRLQSRNLVVVDLALAMLLAFWADGWLRAPPRAPGGASGGRRLSVDQALGLLGALSVVGVVAVALTWGAGFLRWLGVSVAAATETGGLEPWLVPFLVIALLAAAAVVAGPRLRRSFRGSLLAGLVVVDLAVFAALGVVAVAPGAGTGAGSAGTAAAAAPGAGPARPVSSLGSGGRFALYDPDLLDGGELTALGAPDLNVMSGAPSVLGYGSIVDGVYAAVTGSHQPTGRGQNVFDPRAASDGALDQLDTTLLLTPPAYLVTRPGQVTPAPGSGTGSRLLGPGVTTSWYFGQVLTVGALRVPFRPGRPGGSAPVELGLLEASGAVAPLTGVVARSGVLRAAPAHPVAAVGLVAQATGGATVGLGAPTLLTSGGGRYVADGQLQGAVVAPHWRFAGFDGAFAVFRNTRASPPVSLRPPPGRPLGAASVRVLERSDGLVGAVAVSSPGGAEVLRAVAAIPGWTASWRPAGSPASTSLPVRRSGLVQAVEVPRGRGTLTWRYDAPGLGEGLWLSGAALLLVVGLLLAGRAGAGGRRRLRRPGRPGIRTGAVGS